jgi:archaellum component FlaF (FlaF/FlaG flagellin family)
MKNIISTTSLLMMFFVTPLSFAQNLNEGFEGSTFPPEDWSVINDGGSNTWVSYGTTPNTGASSAAISYNTTAHDDFLITPKLSIVANDSIHFWTKNQNTTYIDEFDVLVSTTTNAKASFVDTLQLGYGPGASWEKKSYTLNAYAGQDIYVAIKAKSTDKLRLYIDDVSGPALFVPSCIKVPTLETANLMTTSTDVSWSSVANATLGYEYVIEDMSGTLVSNGVTTDTFTSLTGLTANTDYLAKVRTICSSTDTSAVKSLNFTTPCGAVATFTEGFEGLSNYQMPDCWDKLLVTNSTYANVGPNSGYTPATGSRQLFLYNSSSVDSTDLYRAISPELSNISAGTHRVRFSARSTQTSALLIIGSVVSVNDTASFVAHDTIQPTSAHLEYIIDITAPANHTKLAFEGILSNNTYSRILIDDVVWEQIPSCLPVENIAIDSIDVDFAQISWDSISNASLGYNYSVTNMATNAIVASGISADNFVALNNLDTSISYFIDVQAICSAGDTSTIESLEFTTLCAHQTELYEGFEGFSSYNLPGCWNKDVSASSTFANVGANSGYSPIAGTRQLFFYNSSSTDSTDRYYAFSPSISNLADSTHRLRFFARSTKPATLQIGTVTSHYDMNSFVPVQTINVNTTTVEHIINLVAPASHKKIVLKADLSDDTYTRLFVDEFNWELIPTCVKPVILDVTPGDTMVDINWTNPSSAANFQLEYGLDGFTQGAGTIINTTDTFATINGLSDDTDYEFYVRSICAPGDTSEWTVVNDFTTVCTYETGDYTQDFSSYIPDCWIEFKEELDTLTTVTTTSSFWTSDGFGNNGTTGAARINIYSTNRTEWLASPVITLAPGHTKSVKFDASLTQYNSQNAPTGGPLGSDDKIGVYISLDGGATWSDTNALIEWTASSSAFPSNTGTFYELDLSAYTGNVRIGFYGESTASGGDRDFIIDNFEVSDLSTCFVPSILNVTPTDVTAEINWTNPSSAPNFEIEYGLDGFTQGTGTIVNSADTFTTLNGLDPQTEYQFYVRAICGAADTSNWTSAGSFETTCSPETGNYTEDFASYVPDCWMEFKGELDTLTIPTGTSSNWTSDGFLNSGFSGSAKMNIFSTNRYEWLASPVITLAAGHTKKLKFDAGLTQYASQNAPTGGPLGADDKIGVYISLDGGATWSDTNSLIVWTSATAPSHTGDNYEVDLSAYTGNVRIGFYAESTASGGDRDFFIDNFEIYESISDLALTNIAMTNTLCDGDSTLLSVNVANIGTEDLSNYSIDVLVNGTVANNFSYTDTIVAGDTIVKVLNQLNYAVGNYTIDVVVNHGDDDNSSNDTISSTLDVVSVDDVNAGNDTTVCAGDEVILTASGANSYKWDASPTYGNNISVFPTTTTEYYVLGISAGGCFTTDTIVVTVAGTPDVNAGADASVCEGSDYDLVGSTSNGATLEWLNLGATGNTANVNIVSDTSFVLQGTSAAGCISYDTVMITLTNLADPTILYQSGSLFTTGSYTTYEWSFNGAVVSTSSTYTPTQNGVYTLKVTNADGCTAESEYEVMGIAVSEEELNAVSFYPNPVTSTIFVNDAEIFEVEIVDIQGKVLVHIEDKVKEINVEELAPGTYVLKGKSNKGNFVHRFVKQ